MDDRKPAAKKQPDRRKRKATATASSSSEAADLLPWIQRAQLENLITSSINNSSAITVHDLINAMPEAERWRVNEKTGRKKSSYTPVKGGAERINTGSFDIVDSTTMLNILTFLNCKERHTCVTSVCKGWREFKTSMPTLFLDLSDTHGWSVKGRAMQASQLLELMDWVPNLSAVTALRISTQDKCNPNTCKQIVKKLVAAKKKAKNAPMITKLVLQGPKIYGTLLTELKKAEIGKSLTYLRFENVKITAQTKLANSLPDLLRSLPRLEELYLPQSLAVDGSLHTTVLGPLSAARSGSKSTLLRVLDLTTENHVYSHNRLSLHDLSRIGEYPRFSLLSLLKGIPNKCAISNPCFVYFLGNSCPELEVLRLVAVAGSPIYRSSFLSGINPELIVASPIAPTPRLKEFEVRQLTDTFVYGHAPRCEF
jgi:hypothetical protein